MARKNVRGVCPLCLKPARLCKSHYLGRVLHKLSRTGKEQPVVMTPKLVEATPRQLWAHLLCASCEQRFNDKGEKPVLALFNGEKGFPLLQRMDLALHLGREPGVIKYSGARMGVDTEPLAYYALSVLWKGSVHNWRTLKGQTSSVDLGKYQEPIRRYLLGQAGFPDGVYVLVAVCTDRGSQGMNFAPAKVRGSKYPMYSILARGLWFHVITTDVDPSKPSPLCCARSVEKVIYKEDCSKRFFQAGRHILETAAVSPELRSPARGQG